MSEQSPLVALEGVVKRYRADVPPVLASVQLRLHAGECLAIMGESGAGKSTLLNLIAGLDRADAGRVLLDGRDLAALDDNARTRLRRERIGFIFQAFHVLPYLTVAQNVALPLALLGVRAPPRAARVAQMLAACGMAALAERYPRDLSGGELQRIAIARALVHRPRVVLADEPTGNLDAATAAQILQLLRTQLRANDAAALLVTHSIEAARTADRILRLVDGRLHEAAALGTAPASP